MEEKEEYIVFGWKDDRDDNKEEVFELTPPERDFGNGVSLPWFETAFKVELFPSLVDAIQKEINLIEIDDIGSPGYKKYHAKIIRKDELSSYGSRFTRFLATRIEAEQMAHNAYRTYRINWLKSEIERIIKSYEAPYRVFGFNPSETPTANPQRETPAPPRDDIQTDDAAPVETKPKRRRIPGYKVIENGHLNKDKGEPVKMTPENLARFEEKVLPHIADVGKRSARKELWNRDSSLDSRDNGDCENVLIELNGARYTVVLRDCSINGVTIPRYGVKQGSKEYPGASYFYFTGLD